MFLGDLNKIVSYIYFILWNRVPWQGIVFWHCQNCVPVSTMTMLTLALCVVELFTSHLYTVFSFVQKMFLLKGIRTLQCVFLLVGNHVRLTCLWTFWLRKHIELIMHWAKERCFADCCMRILHTLIDPTLAYYIDFEQASVRKPCKNYPGANETMH